MTQRAVICFTVLGLLVGAASRVGAAPITWEFEGTVRYANLGDASALAGSLGVSVGASASGRVVYESTTPDLFPGSGTYASAVTAFEVAIGSYEVGELLPDTFNAFYVRLEPSPGPFDLESALGIAAPDGLFPDGLYATLGLISDTPGIIPDVSLPGAPPPLSALRPFSIEDWLTTIGYGTGLQLFRGGSDEMVLVELTRLEVVPEPGAFVLLALASVALVWRRGLGG